MENGNEEVRDIFPLIFNLRTPHYAVTDGKRFVFFNSLIYSSNMSLDNMRHIFDNNYMSDMSTLVLLATAISLGLVRNYNKYPELLQIPNINIYGFLVYP